MSTTGKRGWLAHWTARHAAKAPLRGVRTPRANDDEAARKLRHDRMISTLIVIAILTFFALMMWQAINGPPIELPNHDYYYWLP